MPPSATEQQGTHSLFQGETSGAPAAPPAPLLLLLLPLLLPLCMLALALPEHPANSRTCPGASSWPDEVPACEPPPPPRCPSTRAGLHDAAPRREHFGETAAGGAADARLPGTASAQLGGGAPAAGSHFAGHHPHHHHHHHHHGEAAAQQGQAKRKMSEMGEVGGPLSPGAAAATGGMRAEEVQECDMQQAGDAAAARQPQSADSGGEGGTAGFNRCAGSGCCCTWLAACRRCCRWMWPRMLLLCP